MSEVGRPWTTSPSEDPPEEADPSLFSDAAEAAEFAGFSIGPPPIDEGATQLSSSEAGSASWHAEPEPTEPEATAWEVDAEAPVIVDSRRFADDTAVGTSTVDIVPVELAVWDGRFGAVSVEAEDRRRGGDQPADEEPPTSATRPDRAAPIATGADRAAPIATGADRAAPIATGADRAASIAASWIPPALPSRPPAAGSVFAGPVVPPPVETRPPQETTAQEADSGSDGWLGPEPPAPEEAGPEETGPEEAGPEEAGPEDAGPEASAAETASADRPSESSQEMGPAPDEQPGDRWWIEPGDRDDASPAVVVAEQPAATEEGPTMPPQARREPEPVESIGASFGAWFPPAADRPLDAGPSGSETPSEHPRALAPLAPPVDEAPPSEAARSPATLADQPAPSQPIRTLSVLRPAAGSGDATDELHAVAGHPAATTVAGVRGDGEIRSPVVAALLTLLAVLVVVVIVLGFLYMFTGLL